VARKVTDPHGVRWHVGRQWAPWRVRVRPERPDWGDGGGGGDWLGPLDDAAGILVGLGILVAVALAFLVIWPIVALAVELVIVLVGVLVTVVGRLVLRKPWTVVARARGGRNHRHVWSVAGWRASGELVDGAAEALRLGHDLPEGAATFGTAPAALPRVGDRG